MGLEQLRRSVELKERLTTSAIDTRRHTSYLKHAKKPLMERYRRQKINNYLEELKCLVLSALNKEVSLYNKMEKADILDMAVNYIKAVRATSPETTTIHYRPSNDTTTTMTPCYQMHSPSPPENHSLNNNYDNFHQSSRSIQHGEMNENCAIFDYERPTGPRCFPPQTGTTNAPHYSQQEFCTSLTRRTACLSTSCQSDNCEPTEVAAIATKIWRPW